MEIKSIDQRWKEAREKVKIPSWDEYFMTMAMMVATRSQDSQWQAGAVLVKDKIVIGTGYNSFPKDMPDSILPNTRPLKYPWVIHSEVNALYNCSQKPEGSTCYTNGRPCLECLKALYQAGVCHYIVTKGKAHMLDQYTEEQKAVYNKLIEWGNIEIVEIEVSLETLAKTMKILQKSG